MWLSRTSDIGAVLMLKGDRGGGPYTPNINAPYGSPAWIQAMQQRYGHMNVHDAIQAGRRALGGKAFDDYRKAHAPTINLNGDLNVTLPKGTPKQHVSMIIQQLVAIGASSNTGAHLPGALTIGGGMTAYT